jgi:hypothetical protein
MTHAASVRCFLAVACLLSYLAVALAPLALARQPDGEDERYASPDFDWSIAWSAPWRQVDEAILPDVDAELLLTNDTSLVVITGLSSSAAPTTCVRQFTGPTDSGESVPLDDTGEAVGNGGRAWAAFRSDAEDLAVYAECRSLDPGQTLLGIVQLVSPADAYGDERRAREELLAGLDQPRAMSQPDPTREASPTVAEPGVVQGAVTNVRGEPLPGVRIVITERDLTTQCRTDAGEFQVTGPCTRGLDATTDSMGRYQLPVAAEPHLEYWVRAFHDVELGGEPYSFELHPADGDRSWEGAAAGIVEDFRWHISGPHPTYNGADATPDEERYPSHYYGGSIDVVDPFDFPNPLVARYPAGSHIELTLEPRGPMLDGSAGEALTVRVDVEGNSLDDPDAYNGYILDLPVGPYRASAVLVLPDGDEVALRLLADCPYGAEDGFTESTDIDFRPTPIYVPGVVGDIDTVRLCATDR